MLLALIISCFCKEKYLYLGKTNCSNLGSEAYRDKKITTGDYICSTTIPDINFETKGNNLYVIILEADKYSGFNNLIQKYDKIFIETEGKYSFDDTTTLYIDSQAKINDEALNSYIFIDDKIKLNIENELPIQLTVSLIYILGTSASVIKKNIIVDELQIIVDKNYVLNDFLRYFKDITFVSYSNAKITDNDQILHQKDITLSGTNLEYIGKEGYSINELIYSGKETIKKINEDGQLVGIHFLQLVIIDQITIYEFIDADVTYFNIHANSPTILTINSPSPIYFPISSIENVIIVSNGKINYDEGGAFSTNMPIDISCFSGTTKDGSKLYVFYEILSSTKTAFAMIFRRGDTKINLDPAFLQFPFKFFESNSDSIVVQSTHFEGLTGLEDLIIYCSDSNCQMDAFLEIGNGRLKTENDVEIKPEYFTVKFENNEKFIYIPMKSDVSNYNVFIGKEIELKKFDGDGKAQYKILNDIFAKSITLDDNISVEFGSNLVLYNDLVIPPNTNIIDSGNSGIKIINESNVLKFGKISSVIPKKFNKIYMNVDYAMGKELVINDLGPEANELTTLDIFFLTKPKDSNINFYKISACKGVNLNFHVSRVYIDITTINVEKKTLSFNTQFSSKGLVIMGDIDDVDNDVYIFYNRFYNPHFQFTEFSKLYLDGNFIFDDNLTVTQTLFIKGYIKKTADITIQTRDLIIDINNTKDQVPTFKVNNAIYTSNIDNFEVISNIISPKVVISGIDSNQNITIQNQIITLNKKDQAYSIDTQKHEKVILYIPHSEILSKLLNDEGNNINLKVGDSKGKHKALDFNIISNPDESSYAKSLLRFTIDESISKNNPEFDGEFGYAFDNGLDGNVVYKEGESGQETSEKPSYLPISLVKVEPFDGDIVPVPDQSSSDLDPLTSESELPDTTSSSDPPYKPTPSSEPDQSSELDTSSEPEPIPTPIEEGGGGDGGSSSSNGDSKEAKASSVILGDFSIKTVFIGQSPIVKFKPGYSLMSKARQLIGKIIPPPNFIHSAIWVGPENALDSTLGAIFVYGKYYSSGNDASFLYKDGARSFVMSLKEFKSTFSAYKVKKVIPHIEMKLFNFIDKVKMSGNWTAYNYNWPTNNCQHFAASCLNILHAIRDSPDQNDWINIPPSILNILEKNENSNK